VPLGSRVALPARLGTDRIVEGTGLSAGRGAGGIERSFQKFRAGKRSYRKVNNLAYCSQEVFRAVEEARAAVAQGGSSPAARAQPEAPFSVEEIARFLTRSADAARSAASAPRKRAASAGGGFGRDRGHAPGAPRACARQPSGDLEELERNLTALEEKLTASLLRATAVELLVEFRAEVIEASCHTAARWRTRRSSLWSGAS